MASPKFLVTKEGRGDEAAEDGAFSVTSAFDRGVECSHVCDAVTQLACGRIMIRSCHAHRHDPQPQLAAGVFAA